MHWIDKSKGIAIATCSRGILGIVVEALAKAQILNPTNEQVTYDFFIPLLLMNNDTNF